MGKIPFEGNPLGYEKSSGGGGIPTKGLVFYWDMTDKASLSANTGQEKTFVGSINDCLTNTTKNGIPCIHCENSNANNFVDFENPNIPSGDAARTISLWANFENEINEGGYNYVLIKYGQTSPSRYKWWTMTPKKLDVAYVSYDFSNQITYETNTWYNIVVTFENGVLRLYINGVLASEVNNCTVDSTSIRLRIFGGEWGTDYFSKGWMSSLRIYDRVLSQDEIIALSQEFIPLYPPTSGLVFYWDMHDKDALSANTGQTKSSAGDIDNCLTNDVNSGLSCIYCENNSSYNYINFENPGIPYGDAERTVSIWANYKNDSSFTSMNGGLLMKYGPLSPEQYKWWVFAPYWIDSAYVSYNFTLTSDFSAYKWYNFIVTFSNGTLKLYVNGSLESQIDNCTIDSVSENLRLFGAAWGDDLTNEAWLTDLRIYDRVLSENEIYALSRELNPEAVITAEDLTCTFYQKDDSFGITYTSTNTPMFTIISGSLPNEISFDTSTGVFSGRAPSDQDHEYDLVVRITAADSTPVDVNVTIHTVAIARITFYGQNILFRTEAVQTRDVVVTYSDEPVTISYYSGTMPSGVTLNNGTFTSDGTQSAAETQNVILKASSEHNQAGVIAEMTIYVQLNQLGLSDKTLNFYTDDGQVTKTLTYNTTNPITPVWSIISGSLPSGVTFDTTSGAFTSDGTQTADVSGTVGVQVASSTGCSTPATAEITLNVVEGGQPIPTSGLVFYAPLTDVNNLVDETGTYTLTNHDMENAVVDGIPCVSSYNMANCIEMNAYAQTFGNEATWSMWYHSDGNCMLFCPLQNSFAGGYRCAFFQDSSILELTMFGDSGGRTNIQLSNPTINEWHHFAISYNSEYYTKVYYDGVCVFEGTVSRVRGSGHHCWGGGLMYDSSSVNKCIAAARIYDRVLTDAEITALATEFTPTI